MVERFHKDGYLILENCVSSGALADVKRLLLGACRDIEKNLSQVPEAQADIDHFLLERPRYVDKQQYQELTALLSGNFSREVKAHPSLWALLSETRLRSVLKTVLRSENLYLHMFPSPRHVAPSSRYAAVPRHVDRQYNSHLSNFITVWVPVETFEPNMGGVCVFPGTHFSTEHFSGGDGRRLETDLWFAPIRQDLDEGVLAEVPRRGALLLHQSLVHESVLNRSSMTRLSVDLRIFGDRDRTTKHYLDLQTFEVFEPPTGEIHGKF